MTELHVRLSQMREAAEKLHRSSYRIGQSARQITESLTYLQAQGLESTALPLYHHSRGTADWGERLMRFAERLNTAADDIEGAYLTFGGEIALPHFRDPRSGAIFVGAALLTVTAAVSEDTPERPTYDAYIAKVNRPLMDKLRDQKIVLEERETALKSLLGERQQTADDLAALKDRIRTFQPDANLNAVPRIAALESQLTDLDGQITSAETEIQDLRGDVSTLHTRLARVTPGAGADLALIAQLESAETSPAVKANTFDCVNYIVGKFPVPGGLALNAHLWDDLALQKPEYGITVGQEPLVGSVLLMEREHPYADSVYGHLMYVERVEQGVVWVTDYQYTEPVPLSELTSEVSGDNLKYLYFPWHTRA